MNKLKGYKFIVNKKKKMTPSLDTRCRVGGVTELADQSVIQATFLLSHLWARVLFDSSTSHSFITTSCVKDLGLDLKPWKSHFM